MSRDVQSIRRAQKARMNRQSWDYLNQNSPSYPDLIVHQGKLNGEGLPMSVGEAAVLDTKQKELS